MKEFHALSACLRITALTICVLAGIMEGGFGSAFAAEPGQPAARPPSAGSQPKGAQPGPEHEKLARYAGGWTVEMKMGSGRAAMTYTGTAENRMVVGGRFLQMEYRVRGTAGEAEGIFSLGFDNRHQRHALIAMDSFGNYFVTSQGKADEKTGQLRLLGTDDDPMMKSMGYTKEFVHVVDWRGADEYAVEVWFVDTRTAARREFKAMEYVFKRKK
jgi:hypothetical protein